MKQIGEFSIATPHGRALTNYIEGPHVRTYIHTEVPPKDRGKGYGDKLIHDALADARANGFQIVAICPFVVSYLARHPEDASSVLPVTHGARAFDVVA